MALNAEQFTVAPQSEEDAIVKAQDSQVDSGDMLVDYSKSAAYHTEPLFLIGKEQMYGYENYKQYDQVQGHGIRTNPQFQDDTQGKETYLVEESGKRYASGKTYYLGFQTIMIPVSKN